MRVRWSGGMNMSMKIIMKMMAKIIMKVKMKLKVAGVLAVVLAFMAAALTACGTREDGIHAEAGAGAGMGMASETAGSEGDGECQEEGENGGNSASNIDNTNNTDNTNDTDNSSSTKSSDEPEKNTDNVKNNGTYIEDASETVAVSETTGQNSALSSSNIIAPAVCKAYYRAGQVRLIAYIVPGDHGTNTKKLTVNIFCRNLDFKHAWNLLMEADMYYQPDIQEYTLNGTDGGGNMKTYVLRFTADNAFTLEGEGAETGDYCDWITWNNQLILPDSLGRLLNETDLAGLDQKTLRLLRNQFYATYGRKFQDDELKTYFEGTDWYRGLVEPEDFDEEALTILEKKNLEFVKNAEALFDEKKVQEYREAYNQLPAAPYLKLLPYTQVIGMKFGQNAVDKGIYYCVQGTISLPVTISEEQHRKMELGERVEVTVNTLTRETAFLEKLNEGSYFNYQIALQTGSQGSGSELIRVHLAEGAYDGGYTVSQNMLGMIMKPVYKGDIYVLKGADTGTGYQFDDLADGTGTCQKIEFHGNSSAEYEGNRLIRDQKGYVKGIYYFKN